MSFDIGCKNALVVGAAGGIGGAIIARLIADQRVSQIDAWARREHEATDIKVRSHVVDITDEASIASAAEASGHPELVIVATGQLHSGDGRPPEKSWRQLDRDHLIESFLVNAVGPALVAKHLLGRLPRDRRAVFAVLSARVGSIADNRLGGWYGYRASKAALHQIIRTASIELARVNPQAICVALHPGTVDTGLSRPFQGNVPDGQLFSPDQAAGHLLRVIEGLNVADTGGVFAWDGQRIAY